MKEFVEKLIGRLEELKSNPSEKTCRENILLAMQKNLTIYSAIEIVNQLAEEYKDKVIIDGQYCWQTCGANEHCKECNRLSNGSIDYYENYDCLAEEYNNGWIPCSERLPENPCWTITCDEEENIHIFFYRNGYFCESYGGKPITEQNARYYVPIAWMPLPVAFRKGE